MLQDHYKLRVLVVDDDPICASLLESHLQAAGHEVISARSAQAAMDIISRETVQLIIVDWVMPEMSGLELCRWLRRQSLPQPMHLVMLTAHAERERLIDAFAAGVDDFLSKPLHEAELLARLRAWERFIHLQSDLAAQHAAAMKLNEQLAAANEMLARLAVQDDLTLLPNRRAATERLNEYWSIACRYDQPLSCALVDVDRFKRVNDTHGHAAGDEVLRQVAAALVGCCRAADAVFRTGGDEFLLLLPSSDLDAASVCAERCRAAVADLELQMGGQRIECTISIGVAERTPAMQTPDELLREADEALYASKRVGRNTMSTIRRDYKCVEI